MEAIKEKLTVILELWYQSENVPFIAKAEMPPLRIISL